MAAGGGKGVLHVRCVGRVRPTTLWQTTSSARSMAHMRALPQAPAAAAPPSHSAARVQLQRWCCYFYLRLADALAAQADSAAAGAAVQRGLEVAQKQGLREEEVRGTASPDIKGFLARRL
jgi:hypothetical protein